MRHRSIIISVLALCVCHALGVLEATWGVDTAEEVERHRITWPPVENGTKQFFCEFETIGHKIIAGVKKINHRFRQTYVGISGGAIGTKDIHLTILSGFEQGIDITLIFYANTSYPKPWEVV